jgi:isopentenyldiphosphate isomerase
MSKEQSILIDEYDNVIGYKDRDRLDASDRFRITGIWLENNNREVLIAQRAWSKRTHPGLWGPAAAGGVAKGESYEQAAYKELSEEIGVTGVDLRPHKKSLINYPGNEPELLCQWFIGILNSEISTLTLREDEVAQARWVNKLWALDDVMTRPNLYTPSSREWPKLFSDANLV